MTGGQRQAQVAQPTGGSPAWRADVPPGDRTDVFRGSSSQAFSESPTVLPAVQVWKSTPRPVYGQARQLWGQVSCEQRCCRLQSTSSPAARVTPEARPAHVIADAKAFRALAPASQHPLRPGGANPERGADRRTSGMGLGGEKLMGARHRLLSQAVPQGQCLRPHPC